MMPPHHKDEEEPTPICRCRVLYLGSAVPHVTKDGLQGIQEPLKELYPEDGALGAKGIDSWLSVWSNGFLLENMDENRKKVSRFFPIESLHYCAAVRYVLVPGSSQNGPSANGSSNNNTLNRSNSTTADKSAQPRFLPLDSPFARNPNINHPPLFAAILRRTTGIKVLECHVFICKRETAANALVRCSFHSYADSTYAKHLESGGGGQSIYGTLGGPTPIPSVTPTPGGGGTGEATMTLRPETPQNSYRHQQSSVIEVSEDSIDSIEKVEEWKVLANGGRMPNGASPRENGTGSAEEVSVFNGDENHKVWAGKTPEPPEGLYDYGSTLRSFRSTVSGTSHRNRPRQMLMPSSPPPPPIPEEKEGMDPMGNHAGPHNKKDKKKKKRSKSRDALDSSAPPGMIYMGNGSILNGAPGPRKHSSSGSLMGLPRSMMNGHGPPRASAGNGVPPPMKSGTFTGRGKNKKSKNAQNGQYPPFMMYGPHMPPPPHLMPPPGHPLYGMPPYAQPMFAGPVPYGPGPGRPNSRVMEEPIYMPHNARPLSPVASYQPANYPHEAYYNQQQYATIDKAGKHKGANGKTSGKSKKNNDKSGSNGPTPLMMSSDSNAEESDFGAGLHKRGYINERAFSYSIRNEHRSRSFGSLADHDQYGPEGGEPGTNGGPGSGPDEDEDDGPANFHHHHMIGKKDHLNRIMSDLDIADDTLEVREVPPGLYPPPHLSNGPHHGPHPVPPMMSNGGEIGRKKR